MYFLQFLSVLGLTFIQLSSTYGLKVVVETFSTLFGLLSASLWSHLFAKIIFSLNIDFRGKH
tara:strand:+ start:178 stop:363 length:186 start_codon:yes stop_codon:yes gene_type:complete